MEKISVIIPTYNGEAFIGEALQSVFDQTRPVDEIIVVDDGSSDATIEIVNKYPGKIRLIEITHKGNPAFGRNIGLEIATGDFVTFLDQDDLWPQNKIEIQCEKMNLHESPDIIMGKTEIIYEHGVADKLKLKEIFHDNRIFLLSVAMFRKSAFDKIGLFNSSLASFGTDTDWFLRAREAELLFYLQKDTTLFWRRHLKNQLSELPTWRNAVIEIFKTAIQRNMKVGTNEFKPQPAFRIINET